MKPWQEKEDEIFLAVMIFASIVIVLGLIAIIFKLIML
jgi:hypothetical protein